MSEYDGETPSTHVSRRTILRRAGIGIGAVAVAGMVGASVRAEQNGAFAAGEGSPYELWHSWATMTGTERIVAAGLLSSNPHNTQPWFVDIGQSSISLHSDPSRRMPINDASAREHFAGLGCAIENMVVAARASGQTPTVRLFPDAANPDLVATIELEEGSAEPMDVELAAAIPDRHTNRGPYKDDPVGTEILDRLSATASTIDSTGVTWVSDPSKRTELGALYVEATKAIAADPEQSAEAFSWFRNDRGDIDEHRDGLTLDCQGLDGVTLLLAKVLPGQSRADGDKFWIKSTRDVHTATSAAYGIVTVDDVGDRAQQVAGGRLLARLHLEATAMGLGFHHMNQITERIDRDAQTGAPDAFSNRWSSIIGIPASTGLVSFRIGYPERPAGLSPRRALTDVVRQ